MGLFSKILGKLGIGKKEEEKTQAASAALSGKPTAAPVKPAAKPASFPGAPGPKSAAQMNDNVKPQAKPAVISEVDVVAKLEEMGRGKGLNWKVSIVDLLKLLDIDSSFEARKELATELNCPPELMGDSAKMNTWLHKEVLRQIAANGGNIPKELLD
jgi:hypothetical protein